MNRQQPAGSRYVTHRGQRIHYMVEGEGPLVVLAHGGLSDGRRFHESGFAGVLADGFRVASPDSLGHGLSDKPGDASLYDIKQRAGDLIAVMRDLGYERAHFVGYSMGGWTVSGVAMHYPQHVASLTVGGWDVENGMSTAAKAFGLPAITFDVLISIARQQAPKLMEWVTPEVEPGLRAAVDAINTLDGTADAVAAIRAPVLFWLGKDDPYHAPMEVFTRQHNIPLLTLPGDHVGTMEQQGWPAAREVSLFIQAAERRADWVFDRWRNGRATPPAPQGPAKADVLHVFASAGWFGAVKATLEELVAGAVKSGALRPDETFSMCETYRNVPANVSGSSTLAWHFAVADGQVSFGLNEIADPDMKVEGDYNVLLPLAQAFFEGAPPPALMGPAIEAAKEGRFKSTGPRKPMPAALAGIHNRIAAFTK